MKKRIGNDITFVWTVQRKNGEQLTPEDFTGKECVVELYDDYHRKAVIDDVEFTTGQVTFTFWGKDQKATGGYTAVLSENRGAEGMVTIDTVRAVTLVEHSYQEDDGDDGDVIEATSVELTSTISAGGSSTPIDAYTKAETDALLADKVDVLQIQGGYTASRYMSGTSFSDNSDQQGRMRSAAYEVGGITLVDLNGNIAHLQVNGVLQLNGKALATEDDTALLVDGGDYNSQSKEIELKHGNTVLARIDARAFVKDGMVDSVVVENGYIVVTFNTDAGKEAISLALTDIFNPANYYDKTAVDNLLANKVDKVSGKGLSTEDYTTAEKIKLGDLPTNSELTTALAGKQDTISDLDSIRSGATAGATAVQPADLTPIDDRLDDVEYCLGDYIKEIYTFNKDNVSEVTTEPVYTTQTLYTTVIEGSHAITCDCKLSADSQSFRALWLPRLYGISDPGRIVFTKSGKATIYLVLRTSQSPAPSPYDVYLNVYDALDNVVMTVYSRDLVYNSSRICTAFTCDVANGYYIKVLYGDSQHAVWLGQIDLEINEVKQISTDVHANSNAISAIEQKIPAQASSSNQLADKDFVNSSIATATATYRGSYNLVSDLSLTVSATQQQITDALATKMAALSITPDNNDYCFVQIPTADATPTEIARIDRYKYDGTAWAYEYSLNNSSFTAEQWAAINSSITSGLVAKLSALPTNSELAALLNGKANTSDLAEVAACIAGKQDKMPIAQVASGTTAINAAVNTYYEVAGEVGTLAITLPTPTDASKVSMVVIHLTAGTNPNVVIGSTAVIDYSAAYDISASKEYEINCLFNGDKWIVADMEVV